MLQGFKTESNVKALKIERSIRRQLISETKVGHSRCLKEPCTVGSLHQQSRLSCKDNHSPYNLSEDSDQKQIPSPRVIGNAHPVVFALHCQCTYVSSLISNFHDLLHRILTVPISSPILFKEIPGLQLREGDSMA